MTNFGDIGGILRYLPIKSFFGDDGEITHIADMHCDSISMLSHDSISMPAHDSATGQGCGESGTLINPRNFSRRYPQLQFTAVWCRPSTDDGGRESFRRALSDIERFRAAIEGEGDKIAAVTDGDGIKRAFEARKHAALLSVEGGGVCLGGDIAVLREFYSLGVRVFGLAWESNSLAASSHRNGTDADTGLSEAGKAFVREGNRIGMAFDVSHLSDRSARDVLALSELPVFATHSDFRALTPHNRNLPDDIALKIAESGGVIGLNIYPPFIAQKREEQNLSSLKKHLEYGKKLVGEEHLSLGMDIDGIERYPDGVDTSRSVVDAVVSSLFRR